MKKLTLVSIFAALAAILSSCASDFPGTPRTTQQQQQEAPDIQPMSVR